MALTISVPYFLHESTSAEELSKEMDVYPKNSIGNNPWAYPFSGTAEFSMAHNNEAIFLKYYVSEEHIRAFYTQPNDPVYKDSCVEFFISFNGEPEYYNLEFNCKGTSLVGFGPHKENRQHLKPETVNLIKTFASFNNNLAGDKGLINWELTLIIPKNVFTYHNLDSFSEKTVKVNFYKCGDELPVPHYLCWNNIGSTDPNFHLPEYFGEAIFK